MSGDIAAVGHDLPARQAPSAPCADEKLKHACNDFEGMLVGIILKQGMQTPFDEDETPGNGLFKEFALEQTAIEMGRNESFGIAKLLYESLSQKGPGHAK